MEKNINGSRNPIVESTSSTHNVELNGIGPNQEKPVGNLELKWYTPGDHRKIIQNVMVVSIAFAFLFTAFLGMANLQSSIHPEGGLGVYAMSLTHVLVVISALFLPTFVIQRFSPKYTIVYAMIGYTTFQAAQYYPSIWTLIPSAVIVGICAAPLWAAKCTYIAHVGHLYAEMMGQSAEEIVVRFFGFFFLSFQSSLIWGNLISSVVLSYGRDPKTVENTTIDEIVFMNATIKDTSVCGRNFCPSNAIDDGVIMKPPASQIYILATIYLVLNLTAAAVIFIFLDPLSRFSKKDSSETEVMCARANIIATVRQMGQRRQILLIPLTLWSGLNLGFYFADFSQAFVACALGVGSIGYIGMAFGICDAVFSIGFGVLVRYLGRLPVFTFGAILNLTIVILLFYWDLKSTHSTFLLIISAMWGVCDAIWQTQINGLYGLLFKKSPEAAFSNYRLWESLGFIIGFANSNLLCVHIKLWILIGVLCTGMCGYYTAEYLERAKLKK